jgi:hypothetical protein
MGLRQEWEERERQWREFHAWEAENSTPEREPSAVLADLSFLLREVPAEEILLDPDPEKLGIARMRATLAAISRR